VGLAHLVLESAAFVSFIHLFSLFRNYTLGYIKYNDFISQITFYAVFVS
jgi:hypothetical protein